MGWTAAERSMLALTRSIKVDCYGRLKEGKFIWMDGHGLKSIDWRFALLSRGVAAFRVWPVSLDGTRFTGPPRASGHFRDQTQALILGGPAE